MNCILIEPNTEIISDSKQVSHINKILKLTVGDTITIGEKNGNTGKATIARIEQDQIILTNKQLATSPPPKLDVTVILALPRPKVLRRLIMDMTALGVNKIILLNSYCTQKSYWQSPMLDRIDEFVHEGLQQAVDTVAPIIELKKRFKPFVEDDFKNLLINKQTGQQGQAIIAHPYSSHSWQEYLQNIKQQHNAMPNVLCIGAEGGWIDYEVDLLVQHGCTAVSLGNRILRTEAVVNVMLGSWLSYSSPMC